MPSKLQPKRGRGRPASGKRAYCIRMLPTTHATLVALAMEEGCHPGDWLDEMAFSKQAPGVSLDLPKRLGKAMALRRFKDIAANTTASLQTLYELIDYDPSIADGEAARAVINEIGVAYSNFRRFLQNV